MVYRKPKGSRGGWRWRGCFRSHIRGEAPGKAAFTLKRAKRSQPRVKPGKGRSGHRLWEMQKPLVECSRAIQGPSVGQRKCEPEEILVHVESRVESGGGHPPRACLETHDRKKQAVMLQNTLELQVWMWLCSLGPERHFKDSLNFQLSPGKSS